MLMIVCGGRTNTISEAENRKLTQFPAYSMQSVISGRYFRELENYVADHMAFRESAVIVPSGANNIGDAHRVSPVNDADAAVQKPESASKGPVAKVLILGDRAMNLYAYDSEVLYYKPSVKHRYVVHYSGPLQLPLLDASHTRKKNKYRIFLSGDRPWGQITTEVDNQRKIAVIKDSYGNALVPFLLPHYSEIYVVDPRQFNESIVEFIRKHRIQELLYVNNAEVTMDRGFAVQLRKLVPQPTTSSPE